MIMSRCSVDKQIRLSLSVRDLNGAPIKRGDPFLDIHDQEIGSNMTLKEALDGPRTFTEFMDDFSAISGLTDFYAYTYLFTPGNPGKWQFLSKDIAFKPVSSVKEVHGDQGLLYEVTVSESSVYRATRKCNHVLKEYLGKQV